MQLWKECVNELRQWMQETSSDGVLWEMVVEYLLAHGDKTMRECVHVASPLHEALANSHDRLGWDNFIAGRISKVYLETVTSSLLSNKYYSTEEGWGRHLVKSLMIATHKQWLFRNAHVHFRKLEGLTAKQHEEVFELVEELMLTDPEELLAKHRYLVEVDFEELAEAPTSRRQNWASSMQSALDAAAHVRSGKPTLGSPGTFSPRPARLTSRPSADGSIVYRHTTRELV